MLKRSAPVLLCFLASACGAAPASVADPSTQQEQAAARALPWREPENRGPQRWLVIGPFAQGGDQRDAALDRDYLAAIGGEGAPRIDATTTLEVDGHAYGVKAIDADDYDSVDLKKLYGGETDLKVAYAFGRVSLDKATPARASFGSDDGAAVWINGTRVHRLTTPGRGLNPESDHFEVELKPGDNTVLVKVENGSGGWAFALELLDEQGQAQKKALDLRRHLERLELGPQDENFQLGDAFPEIVWRHTDEAELVFGQHQPAVRWFDPQLAEVKVPGAPGRYLALVEAQTRDGYTHRTLLTFAKMPPGFVPPDVPYPPFTEPPPVTTTLPPELSPAQRAEVSRLFWRSLADYMRRGQDAAVARSALLQLGQQPPPAGEPAWLSSGFMLNAEQQLALRMKLEARAPKLLPPPAELTPRAGELRYGDEAGARVKPGTAHRLRMLSRAWLKEDPNGFVVLVARNGVIFLHEGYGGFNREELFRPASIGKMIAGLTFARAVDQGLVAFDDPVGTVLPEWQDERTARVTFRNCFNHVIGTRGHVAHGGLFNPYLDNALLVQDLAFVKPLDRHQYNGDSYDLAGKALELLTGKTMLRILYENVQKPFAEPVSQFDLGFGDRFNARYLAKVGQMLLQDGAYGRYRFYSPGFVQKLMPQKVANHVPGFADQELEWGIGQTWQPDAPDGKRENAPLSPNTFGHGAASGSIFRVDPDNDIVIVIGRNQAKSYAKNDEFAASFARTLADGLVKAPKPATKPAAPPAQPAAPPAQPAAPPAQPAAPPAQPAAPPAQPAAPAPPTSAPAPAAAPSPAPAPTAPLPSPATAAQ
jgi:CubicO group peptidase (beta-lactamase class C family)